MTKTFDVVVDTNNVMSLPLNHQPVATMKAGGASTVRMLQEIDGKGLKAAAEKIPGFTMVDIPDGNTYSCGIIYKGSVWQETGHRYVLEYKGVGGISLTRHMAVAELKHRPTGQVVAFVSFHNVTAGNDKNRKRMRRAGLKALRAVISGYRKLGIPIVVGGDYNGTGNYHPTAAIHFRHKIDHIFVWNGKRWTFHRKSKRAVNTASDHDSFIVRMRAIFK